MYILHVCVNNKLHITDQCIYVEMKLCHNTWNKMHRTIVVANEVYLKQTLQLD